MRNTAPPKPARKLPRDASTGQFEPSDALNDSAKLDQAVRWVRAIDELRPLLLAFADDASPNVVAVAGVSCLMLDSLKQSMLDALSVDKVALRDATKPRLHAVRYVPGGAA